MTPSNRPSVSSSISRRRPVLVAAMARSRKASEAMTDVDIGLDDSDDERDTSLSSHSTRAALFTEEKQQPVRVSRVSDDADIVDASGAKPSVDALQRANRDLVSQLRERDSELRTLSEALLAMKESALPADLDATGDHAAIIRDLMRKQRELHSILTRERAKHTQELHSLRDAAAAATGRDPSAHSDGEAAALQQELSLLNSRLTSSRTQVKELKGKLSRATAILARELGDESEASTLLNDSSGDGSSSERENAWRGRAEKIATLQSQLKELKRKSAAERPTTNSMSSSTLSATTPLPAMPSVSLVEHEKLSAALREARAMLDAETNRLTSAKARIKILETETKELKSKLLVMVGKSETDDTLIDKLKAKYTELKSSQGYQLASLTRAFSEEKTKLETENKLLQNGSISEVLALRKELLMLGSDAYRNEMEIQFRNQFELIRQLQQQCDHLQQQINNQQLASISVSERSTVISPPVKSSTKTSSKPAVSAATQHRSEELLDREREVIRESYAAMLNRRDEEIEALTHAREEERALELAAREAFDEKWREIEDAFQRWESRLRQ